MNYDELCRRAALLGFVAPSRVGAAAWGATWTRDHLLSPRPVRTIVFAKQSAATAPVVGAAVPGDADEIIVADGLSLRDTVRIAAEEAHHALTRDGDEAAAKGFGRAAAADWTAERRAKRQQLHDNLTALFLRWNGGRGLDEPWGVKGTEAVGRWYGAATMGVGAAVELGLKDLDARLDELDELDCVPAGSTDHLRITTPIPPRPQYSYERERGGT